jgi:hypothetical protein
MFTWSKTVKASGTLLLIVMVGVSLGRAADEGVKLGFDRLAGYKFVAPEFDPTAKPGALPPVVDGQIPDDIKAYDARKVVLTGYMLPIKMEGLAVAEFMLVSSPAACCYGAVPNLNEWVIVKMKPGEGIPVLMDVPVSVKGILKVGGVFEGGYLTAIYTLAGERLATTD